MKWREENTKSERIERGKSPKQEEEMREENPKSEKRKWREENL